MITLFVEGGPLFMAVLTILFVALFFEAWKAPGWLKETGSFALAFGLFSLVLGLRQMFGFIQSCDGEISSNVICGGLKVAMIPVLYGIIIYLVSLVIRVILKPRL